MTWKKNRRNCLICRDEYGVGNLCMDCKVDVGLIPTKNITVNDRKEGEKK